MAVKDRQVRKRRKHDDLPLTSIEYLERKNEPMAPEKLEDFEIFCSSTSGKWNFHVVS